MAATDEGVCLRIVNVTDVYKLSNFPSLKTLIEEKRKEVVEAQGGDVQRGKLVSILTGDFLAPYLLSALDHGRGMVRMMNSCPIDITMFGNHEDDLPHEDVVQRASEYQGIWINTNMQTHEAFQKGYQVPYHIIEVGSGEHRRKIGLIAVLSDSPGLYRVNAFNGAKIECPYETMRIYKEKLEKEEGVDVVIPLCHLYVPQDHVTCRMFDFPVVLSGHDHHTVQETFDGTLLLKAGSDANHAVVVDISWPSAAAAKPDIAASIVKVGNWSPDPALSQVVVSSENVLSHLRHTEICHIAPQYRPLTSANSRGQLCSMARFLWTTLRQAVNLEAGAHDAVDCVLISGGDLRGDRDYPDDSIFTLEDLMNEIQEKLKFVIVPMPGHLIAQGVQMAHSFGSSPAFTQLDDGITLDPATGAVLTIAGQPLEPERVYRAILTKWDLQSSPVTVWVDYFAARPELAPQADWRVMVTLLSYFAKHIWRRLWHHLDKNRDGLLSTEEILALDSDGDQNISRKEIAAGLRQLGIQVDDEEMTFINCIMEAAGDRDHDGILTPAEYAIHAVQQPPPL